MSPAQFRRLSAVCGIAGVSLLILSFVINPGPGPHPTVQELAEFGRNHRTAILLGAWLQAVSPFLIMIFALAAVKVSGATNSFPGQLTQVGFIVLIMVSLLEVVFYLTALNGDTATTASIGLELVHSTQHLFSIAAAPAVFFPFAVVILRFDALPKLFGYTAILLAVLFTILGLVALFLPVQYLVDGLAFAQGIWWLLAAFTQLLRSRVEG